MRQLIEVDIARLDEAAARGSDCFFVERSASGQAGRHLSLSREGSRLGIEMIGSMLERLYPKKRALPFAPGEAIARSQQG
jgi:hypothetical protein